MQMMAMACGSECSECKDMHANSYTRSFPIFETIYSINNLKSQVSMECVPQMDIQLLKEIMKERSLEEISQYFEIKEGRIVVKNESEKNKSQNESSYKSLPRNEYYHLSSFRGAPHNISPGAKHLMGIVEHSHRVDDESFLIIHGRRSKNAKEFLFQSTQMVR